MSIEVVMDIITPDYTWWETILLGLVLVLLDMVVMVVLWNGFKKLFGKKGVSK
jgi:hypothetical protein